MDNWRQDPRLKQMDPEKLQYITDFAEQLTRLPKDQLFPALMKLQADAARRSIQFSNEETAPLISILSSGMSPAEKTRLETLRFLAKKLAVRSS